MKKSITKEALFIATVLVIAISLLSSCSSGRTVCSSVRSNFIGYR